MKIEFLKSFFRLFKAKIERAVNENEKIIGVVGWENEDDKQEFSWTPLDNNYDLLTNAKSLCAFIIDNQLIRGDKIIVTEGRLIALLTNAGWDIKIAESAINYLCEIEVRMVDNGKETDSFFIHF